MNNTLDLILEAPKSVVFYATISRNLGRKWTGHCPIVEEGQGLSPCTRGVGEETLLRPATRREDAAKVAWRASARPI